MQILDDIVISKYEPANTGVLWLDISSEYTQIKSYIDGYWKPVPLTHMKNTYVTSNNQIDTQTMDLHDGWNWWSTYLDITLNDLKDALVAALPNGAIVIKAQDGKRTTYNGSNWKGQLSTLDVKQMYEIQVSSNCQITLTGTPLNPTEHPVTIKKGYNWIGYPCQIPHDLEYALKYFNPQEGDGIKLENGLLSIYTNGQWDCAVQMLYPGQGYVYYSNLDDNKTVYFNSLEQVIKDITINGQNMYIQSIGIDNAPTENSSNLITSGAVYAALHQNDTTEP